VIKTGLVSVSFRKLSPREIVDVVSKAELDGIEWGGDVHVPHGDLRQARQVRRFMEDAGIKTAAYGSYYKAGENRQTGQVFENILATAIELESDIIRVWAGSVSSTNADEAHWTRVIEDLFRICEIALKANKTIALEYHANSLTDTKESARKLLDRVLCNNLKTLWQPAFDTSVCQNIERLNGIKDKLSNLHVFYWFPAYQRHLLLDGCNEWMKFFDVAKNIKGQRYALLEFFLDDSLDNFFKDAKVLKKMIEEI